MADIKQRYDVNGEVVTAFEAVFATLEQVVVLLFLLLLLLLLLFCCRVVVFIVVLYPRTPPAAPGVCKIEVRRAQSRCLEGFWAVF